MSLHVCFSGFCHHVMDNKVFLNFSGLDCPLEGAGGSPFDPTCQTLAPKGRRTLVRTQHTSVSSQ